MYYRQSSEEYDEKNNIDSCNELDEYEDFYNNMPYYRQQTLNSPQYYQMAPFYPLMWNTQTIKGQSNDYRYKVNNCPEENMQMKYMHVLDEEDEDLKMLYPKIYIRIQPIVKHHCDMMVSMNGNMHCPSKNEIDHICKEMCDNYDKQYRGDEDDDNLNDDDDEYMRQRRRFNRRRGVQDLFKILLINELLGRRHGGGY